MFGHTTYVAITALILNLTVSAVLSVLFKWFGLQEGYDETTITAMAWGLRNEGWAQSRS